MKFVGEDLVELASVIEDCRVYSNKVGLLNFKKAIVEVRKYSIHLAYLKNLRDKQNIVIVEGRGRM